jgi:hypothetical protein
MNEVKLPRKRAPLWLVDEFQVAMLGNITANMRAIAVRFELGGQLLVRFYFEQRPSETDQETADILVSEFECSKFSQRFSDIRMELVSTDQPIGTLDQLDLLLFARKE